MRSFKYLLEFETRKQPKDDAVRSQT